MGIRVEAHVRTEKLFSVNLRNFEELVGGYQLIQLLESRMIPILKTTRLSLGDGTISFHDRLGFNSWLILTSSGLVFVKTSSIVQKSKSEEIGNRTFTGY